MSGVITFKHVVCNAPTVVHEFGWIVLWRFFYSAVLCKHTTFLNIVFA